PRCWRSRAARSAAGTAPRGTGRAPLPGTRSAARRGSARRAPTRRAGGSTCPTGSTPSARGGSASWPPTPTRTEAGRPAAGGRSAVVAVGERHTGRGGVSFAPVVGQELGRGAFATTYAHGSHNLTAVATAEAALRSAAADVVGWGGGMRMVREDGPGAGLPLPVGGVMSDRPAPEVAEAAGAVRAELSAWGWRNRNAFMSLSTLTLAVSPSVK